MRNHYIFNYHFSLQKDTKLYDNNTIINVKLITEIHTYIHNRIFFYYSMHTVADPGDNEVSLLLNKQRGLSDQCINVVRNEIP